MSLNRSGIKRINHFSLILWEVIYALLFNFRMEGDSVVLNYFFVEVKRSKVQKHFMTILRRRKMRSFKKVSSLLLVFVLALSMTTISYAFGENFDVPEGYTFENYIPPEGYTFDENDVPSDLPEGTIKIGYGIYLYTPEIETCNSIEDALVGTVPAIGTIIQPYILNNIKLDTGHRYIWCKSSAPCKINFVRGNISVFGQDYYSWPNLGSSWVIIDALAYNMLNGVAYQAQLTGVSDVPRSNVRITIESRSYR